MAEPAAPLATAQVTSPSAPDLAFSWGGYLEAIGIMLLLLGVLWSVTWLIRRYGKWNFIPRAGSLPRDALFLETQLPLGPKKGLAVVRFLNTRLLLGITEQRITVLKETDVHVQQNNPDPNPAPRFAQVLDEAGSRGEKASRKRVAG